MTTKSKRVSYLFLTDLRERPDVARALGEMIVAWSSAERVLIEALQLVSGLTWAAASTMYFRFPTFESRIKLIRAMTEQWQPEPGLNPDDILQDPARIEKALDKLRKLAVTRNGWVHGTWSFSTKDGSLFVTDYREKPDAPARRKPVKASDILIHIGALKTRSEDLRQSLQCIRFPAAPTQRSGSS